MSTLQEAPSTDDVLAITEDVWRSLVGEDEGLVPAPPAPGPYDTASPWSATVTVSGGWHGSITVELGDDLARSLTRRMLAMTEDEALEDADLADAVGELVNMVGGSLKSILPGPSALSLPTVAAGRAAFGTETVEAARLDAHWREHALRVSVHLPTNPPA
ncbi:chemotaxis protein CheX [Nocardioides sp. YIM 152588]|uniref:chemotaxis protein CheX n=1 Tax=Nocardioides sp. YIM 152588 TaxID=3158259 RepID=UPI0032E3BD27